MLLLFVLLFFFFLRGRQGSVGLWVVWGLVVGGSASPPSPAAPGGAVPRVPAEGERWDVGNSWISSWADPWLPCRGLCADTNALLVWGLLQLNPPLKLGGSELDPGSCPAQLAGSAWSPPEMLLISCQKRFVLPW